MVQYGNIEEATNTVACGACTVCVYSGDLWQQQQKMLYTTDAATLQ